jgi:hypothetical protein
MSYLRYLCLFAHSGVQHIFSCVFCCVLLRIVYPVLPGSLDCPFLIAPSVFSKVYLMRQISAPKQTITTLQHSFKKQRVTSPKGNNMIHRERITYNIPHVRADKEPE